MKRQKLAFLEPGNDEFMTDYALRQTRKFRLERAFEMAPSNASVENSNNQIADPPENTQLLFESSIQVTWAINFQN